MQPLFSAENYATQFVVQRFVTFFEGEQSSLQAFYQFLGILVQDGTGSILLGILGLAAKNAFISLNNTLISALAASNSLSFALIIAGTLVQEYMNYQNVFQPFFLYA